jgi:hypothetical protein
MSNLSNVVLSALADLSVLFSKSEKALGRIKGEKEKAFAATDTTLSKSFGATWFTLSKGDVKKGVKFATEVESCRLAIRDLQVAAKAGNPDSAWSELKAYVKKAHNAPIDDTTKGETRAARRDADEIFSGVILAYRAKVSANTVKDKGEHLTGFQRDCAPLLAAMAELIAKHKIKVTK